MIMKNSTLKDIAEYTHLSIGTVSKYINGGSVKSANQEILDEAIRQLDYHVNTMARGLKTKKSKTIGILTPALDDYFCTNLVEHIERTLYQYGYSLIVCGYHNDPDLIPTKIQFLASRMVDGMIVIPGSSSDDYAKLLPNKRMPIVLVDRTVDPLKCDTVIIDSFAISHQVTDYLLKQKHERVGIILGPDTLSTSVDRKRGFMQAMTEHQVTVNPDYVRTGDYSLEHGYEATKQLLALPDRPTAIFATNFDITLGMIKALKEMKLSFPEDVSIVGFDNLLFSTLFSPSLTIVEQPLKEISDAVAQCLLQRLRDKDTVQPKLVKLQASLVTGESVKEK